MKTLMTMRLRNHVGAHYLIADAESAAAEHRLRVRIWYRSFLTTQQEPVAESNVTVVEEHRLVEKAYAVADAWIAAIKKLDHRGLTLSSFDILSSIMAV